MNKRVWLLAVSLYLVVAANVGPEAEEAVVAYEYAGKWDRYGPAPAEGEEAPVFMRPTRIAVGPDGTVYITENYAPSVCYFTPEGSYLGTLPPPESESGMFGSRGVAAASDGTVYVADHYDLRIVVYDAERSYLMDWAAPYGCVRGIYSPILEDVAVGADGNIYVSYRSPPPLKIGFSPSVRIDCFTPAGSLVAHWVASGYGIGVGPDGTVYVADYRNNFVDAYDAGGRYRGLWGGGGSGAGELRRPTDVAVGPGGTVFVADAGNYRVQYFTSSGRYLGQWGEKGTKAGQFGWISALAVGPDGRVYVVDRGNGRVEYFRPVVRDE